MSDDDFRNVVKSVLSDCVQYVDAELSPDRAKATDYYLGKPFGNEEEGRSQVVLTEVADAIDGMVPSLQRVFWGPEHCCEFVPSRAETAAMAEQATDYVRYVIEQDNAGFLQSLMVLKDGMVRRLGIFKWAWEPAGVEAVKMEKVTMEQIEALLLKNPDVSLHSKQKAKDGTYTIEVTHGSGEGRPRVWALPPEEFIFNRNARELGHAIFYGHRTEKTRGELIAMGIDEDDIDAHTGEDASLRTNPEELARRQRDGWQDDPKADEANDKILYVDGILSIDCNGDGIAEPRRICTIGPGYYPVKNDPADASMGFSIFSPMPEPHTLIGRSVYDKTQDIQKINSMILRTSLDSAAASAFPRMAILEGQVSTADVMNTAIGAPIRERVMNAVRPLEVPFVADKLMPLMDLMQEIIERRTGRNKGAAGLDADALQSTGKEAVGAVLTGSQEQIELIARVFAEMTWKPLMLGIYKMLVLKQPKARMVKLRGRWVDVNPATWDADMDVTVNVALGSTFTDKKIATLMAVAADQKDMAMLTGGLSSPVVPLPKILNTREKVLSLQGIKDFESYYNALPPDWQPPPTPPAPPNPELLWMQTEKEMNHTKAMKELAIKADELALDREKAQWDHMLALRKIEADLLSKKYAADAQFHAQVTDTQLTHELNAATAEAELTMAAHQQVHDQTLAGQDQSHAQGLAEDAQSHAQQMAEQQPTGEA